MRIALKGWMDATGRTPETLSAELNARGVSAGRSLIRAVISDQRRFGIDTIFVLQKMSRGKVNFGNLYIPRTELRKASGE